MGIREDLARRVAKKQSEIADLERQITVARAYISGIEETIRLIDRREAGVPESGLRRGSGPARAERALQKHGKPLHITALLEEIGKPVNRKTRSWLSAGLSAYVRKGEIFTRPAPNVFGLVEWPESVNFGQPGSDEDEDGADGKGDQSSPQMRLAR